MATEKFDLVYQDQYCNIYEAYDSDTMVYTLKINSPELKSFKNNDWITTYDYDFMKAALNTKSKEYKTAQRVYNVIRQMVQSEMYENYGEVDDVLLSIGSQCDPETFYRRVCEIEKEKQRREQFAKEYKAQKEYEARLFEARFNAGLVDY
jgi:hypothetical protein